MFFFDKIYIIMFYFIFMLERRPKKELMVASHRFYFF